MNKLIFRILILQIIFISCYKSAFSTDSKHLVTELQIIDNDTTFRISFYYKNNALKTLETKSFLENDSWISLDQTEWYYKDSVEYKQVNRKWLNSTWEDTYQIETDTNTPNVTTITETNISDGKYTPLKKRVTSVVNSTQTVVNEYRYSDQWILSNVQSNTYENGLITASEIMPDKSDPDSLKYRYIYSYNAKNLADTLVMQKSINGNEFVNFKENLWHYLTDTALITSTRVKDWDTLQNSWTNVEKTEYTYDENLKLSSETFYMWDVQAWTSVLRNLYSYENELPVTKITQQPIYRKWRNISQINYGDIEADDTQTIKSVYDFWGGDVDDLVTAYIPFDFNGKTIIKRGAQIMLKYTFYDNITDPLFGNLESETIDVYPNPTDGICYFNTENYEVSSWILSDLNGKILIEKSTQNNSGVVDLTQLTKGIYILTAQTANGILKQKIIRK